jgi:uncharacterized protein YjiS (DUF1127 family)
MVHGELVMNNQIYASQGGRVGTSALLQGAVHGQRRAPVSVVEGALIRFFDLVLSWRENVRTRHALAQLNDQMLSDIGLSRASAEREASTPFWR